MKFSLIDSWMVTVNKKFTGVSCKPVNYNVNIWLFNNQ